jgi:hypothetical protein
VAELIEDNSIFSALQQYFGWSLMSIGAQGDGNLNLFTSFFFSDLVSQLKPTPETSK